MGQTMMERSPAMSASTSAVATPGNMCVLPSCEIRFEKCEGGMKIFCCCDNDVAWQSQNVSACSRAAVQLLLYVEWFDRISVQSVLRTHQVRDDPRRLLYHVHLR